MKHVVARWHDGSNPFDISYQDKEPADPVIPAIGGRVEQAWLSRGDNLETVSSVSASDLPGGLYLNIEYSCGQDLCPDRLPVRIVNYFEGDGFDINPKYYEDEELILQSDYRSRLLTRVTSDGPVYEENFWLGSYSVRGPLGHYWVGDQKISEVAYEIGP